MKKIATYVQIGISITKHDTNCHVESLECMISQQRKGGEYMKNEKLYALIVFIAWLLLFCFAGSFDTELLQVGMIH